MNVHWSPKVSSYITPLTRRNGWDQVIVKPTTNAVAKTVEPDLIFSEDDYKRYLKLLGIKNSKRELKTPPSPKPFSYLIERSKYLFGDRNPMADALGTFKIISEEPGLQAFQDAASLIARDLDILIKTKKIGEYENYVNFLIDVATANDYTKRLANELSSMITQLEALSQRFTEKANSENITYTDVENSLIDLDDTMNLLSLEKSPITENIPDNLSLLTSICTLTAVSSYSQENPNADTKEIDKKAHDALIHIAHKHLSDEARKVAIFGLYSIRTKEDIKVLKEIANSDKDESLRNIAMSSLREIRQEQLDYIKSLPRRTLRKIERMALRGLINAIRFIFGI